MIGNVLMAEGSVAGHTKSFAWTPSVNPGSIVAYVLGVDPNDADVEATAHIHLDYTCTDSNPGLSDNQNNSVKTQPNSLYLESKPAFFGALEWPWVNSQAASAAGRTKILPAKYVFEGGTVPESTAIIQKPSGTVRATDAMTFAVDIGT
jgi:hypothetical protein